MNYILLILVIFFVFQIINIESARILIVATTVYPSHHLFFRPIFRQLALRGHEVVHLTAFPASENISTLREIDLSFTRANLPTAYRDSSYVYTVEQYYETMLMYTDKQLASKEVRELLDSSEHFDLVINEALSPPLFAFKKRFNCPMIIISSFDVFKHIHTLDGNPEHELLYSLFKKIKENWTFYERLMVFLNSLFDLRMKNYATQDNELVRKHFGENYPPVAEILNEFELVLLNTNVLLNNIRPMSPAFIPIGGALQLNDPKDLPKDLKKYLDSSKHGVIYFNLGTYIGKNSLSEAEINMFLDSFTGLKYNVIWKLTNFDTSYKIPDNVQVVDWVPQQDLLRHKKVKLFITQGGLHSLEETIALKVPTIIIPFVADQQANAERMHEQNLGVRLHFPEITSASLRNTIEVVIHDKTIKDSLKKAANILLDLPMKPIDKAIWWIEYVLRHKGAKHLRARTLPFWKFYYLDCIGFIIISFVFCIFTYRYTFRILKRLNSKEKDE